MFLLTCGWRACWGLVARRHSTCICAGSNRVIAEGDLVCLAGMVCSDVLPIASIQLAIGALEDVGTWFLSSGVYCGWFPAFGCWVLHSDCLTIEKWGEVSGPCMLVELVFLCLLPLF